MTIDKRLVLSSLLLIFLPYLGGSPVKVTKLYKSGEVGSRILYLVYDYHYGLVIPKKERKSLLLRHQQECKSVLSAITSTSIPSTVLVECLTSPCPYYDDVRSIDALGSDKWFSQHDRRKDLFTYHFRRLAAHSALFLGLVTFIDVDVSLRWLSFFLSAYKDEINMFKNVPCMLSDEKKFFQRITWHDIIKGFNQLIFLAMNKFTEPYCKSFFQAATRAYTKFGTPVNRIIFERNRLLEKLCEADIALDEAVCTTYGNQLDNEAGNILNDFIDFFEDKGDFYKLVDALFDVHAMQQFLYSSHRVTFLFVGFNHARRIKRFLTRHLKYEYKTLVMSEDYKRLCINNNFMNKLPTPCSLQPLIDDVAVVR